MNVLSPDAITIFYSSAFCFIDFGRTFVEAAGQAPDWMNLGKGGGKRRRDQSARSRSAAR